MVRSRRSVIYQWMRQTSFLVKESLFELDEPYRRCNIFRAPKSLTKENLTDPMRATQISELRIRKLDKSENIQSLNASLVTCLWYIFSEALLNLRSWPWWNVNSPSMVPAVSNLYMKTGRFWPSLKAGKSLFIQGRIWNLPMAARHWLEIMTTRIRWILDIACEFNTNRPRVPIRVNDEKPWCSWIGISATRNVTKLWFAMPIKFMPTPPSTRSAKWQWRCVRTWLTSLRA